MTGDSPRRSRMTVESAVVLTEEITRLSREITRGANDTIAQLNGGLLSQQRIIENYQKLLSDANDKVAALQNEIGELKKATVDARRLELDFEYKRAELALREQKIAGLLTTLRDVGGAVVMQYMAGRMALPAPAEPAAGEPDRAVELVLADIWPRLSDETKDRLKEEAGTDLICELLTKVSAAYERHQQEQQQHTGS